jgi:hypothetical protein
MASGWTTITRKNLTLRVPKGTDHANLKEYVSILRIEELPLGPTLIGLEVYATLPSVPIDLISRVIRGTGDATARKVHPVGRLRAWSDVWVIPEYINADDLPLDVCLWQNGTGDLTVTTVIAKPYAPTEYVSDRLRVKS